MSNYKKEQLHEFAEIFKALSNPNRLQIFLRLVSCCTPGTECNFQKCAGELGLDMGIAPSTVSHHLKELRNVGLIQMERHGKNIFFWVDPKGLEKVEVFIKDWKEK